MDGSKIPDTSCSIHRTLGVLGERWTFLILREALGGATRFAEFRDALDVAPNLLTDRLNTLVEYGVMTREPYQEPGRRQRFSYHLTPAGRELQIVLGALLQWGDKWLPRPDGPSVLLRSDSDAPLHVAFLDPEGQEIAPEEVNAIRTAAYGL
ncbi:HxlR family transcriptional regulator [Jatrophihabitans sp. GAS493]|uniref:winged helix-turn-helix transcriptional regulator n=1 Tax=Jatrophihabitans sp. GAS493 TaxID=1907575 RepID=UPI000BB83A87|nr:helix-turn-helix domain-containing protein [Jatrophihabitans sp. GAS493]SOD74870.1 HxlR family transcriptional regulator [Jatrophihabitans sp. GAS493]